MTKIKTIAVLIGLLITINSAEAFTARTTSYCAAEDGNPLSCTGERLKEGIIAADLNFYKIGQIILINGESFKVGDCGSSVKGLFHFDVYRRSMARMLARGTIMAECQVLPIKTPKTALYKPQKQYFVESHQNSSCLKSKNLVYSSKGIKSFQPKDELVCMEF